MVVSNIVYYVHPYLEMCLPKNHYVHSLKLTYPLKMCLPKRKVVFQPSIFRGYVSFREGIYNKKRRTTIEGWIHRYYFIRHPMVKYMAGQLPPSSVPDSQPTQVDKPQHYRFQLLGGICVGTFLLMNHTRMLAYDEVSCHKILMIKLFLGVKSMFSTDLQRFPCDVDQLDDEETFKKRSRVCEVKVPLPETNSKSPWK